MPATDYKIWAWGGPLAGSSVGALNIGVAGVAKPASAQHPLELVNEIICGDLGRALRLPIPPSLIVIKEDTKTPHHVSFNFSMSGQNLPPANATAIAADFPDLACGVILFDLWIANADRIERNLAYDTKAKKLNLFDHGRALMCGTNGRQRLEKIDDQDIINGHCLTGEIASVGGFESWNERIKKLPEFYIRETVRDAIHLGLSSDDADFCIDFLLSRRGNLMRAIRKNKGEFFNVTPLLPGMKPELK